MTTISRRLDQTVSRISGIGDGGILLLAQQLDSFHATLERRLRRLVFWRWLVRFMLVGLLAWGATTLCNAYQMGPELAVEVKNYNDLISFLADSVELGFLLLPIMVSVLFFERLLERASFLSMLSQLDLINDQIYDEQFDDNPYRTGNGEQETTDDRLLQCLDCCAALLFIIRMLAQRVASETADRTILEQCGTLRRGAGDNHTRILIKIGILKVGKGALALAATADELAREAD